MGGITRIGIKFGDELTLYCDLPLSMRNPRFSFRQQSPEGRPSKNRNPAIAWHLPRPGDEPLMMRRRHLVLFDCERKCAFLVLRIDEADERGRR
jgi:hypothetical protein